MLLTANKALENGAQFRRVGMTVTDRNCINEKTKITLKHGNACYHSVQNILSSRLLSKI
jgi:hypothetical protein